LSRHQPGRQSEREAEKTPSTNGAVQMDRQ
jgi:hypothetical protein